MYSPQIQLEINGKKIGQNQQTYFIAEAGLNHNGDVKLAKKLVEEAHNSGADAIKFQTYKSEAFLTESSKYFKFFKKVELSYEDFGEIHDHAKSCGITFFSTPFDFESVDYLQKIGVPCFKIASGDLTNMPLIRHIAKMQKPMIISTGIGTIEEVENAISWCMYHNNNKIALLHCVANYPTLPEETNLRAIEYLKSKFNFPVGYSDNGEPVLVDLAAVSIGANLIEKHFTLDKKLDGPDHFFSIDPSGLKSLISQIRILEKIRGNSIKLPQSSEISNRDAIRKSITAKIDIKEGETLSNKNLAIKRPAGGIEPKHWDLVLTKKSKKYIKKDELIKWEDII